MAVSVVTPLQVEDTAYGHIEMREESTGGSLAQVQSTEDEVREYFNDIPVLIDIARCESHFRHTLSNGSVLKGVVDSADTGVMQINLRYHEKEAQALGLDLQNLHDNMTYARHLYMKQGTAPWKASSPCWSHSLAMR